MRMRSGALIADELCQNAAGRLRVDERDLEPEQPDARALVDQLRAGGAQAVELGADVGDGECDMVHARASPGEEAADRRVRPEQLDAALPDPERRRLDALLLDPLAMLDRRAEERGPALDRDVEVVDRDSEMVDPFHASSAAISPAVANLTPRSRHADVHAAVRAGSRPRAAS